MNPNPPLTTPEKRRRRVAIYTRASDHEGLHRQRECVERYVAQQPEWAIVAVYEDMALLNKRHPALSHLMADAKNSAFDMVVVREMSRLSRSIQDLIRIAETLDHCGVGIVTSTEGVDTDTPEGRLVMTLLTVFADNFRDARPDGPGDIR